MIITTYLTSHIDPQRGERWKPDVTSLKVIESTPCVVLNDCFEFDEWNGSKFVRVESFGNPYFERWRLIGEYIRHYNGIVWCVDATDVTLLGNAYDIEHGIIYCGLDRGTCQSKWLRKNHPDYDFTYLGDKPLLNAGVVGGDADTIRRLCDYMSKGNGTTDMGAFNIYTHALMYVTDGVCTPFKEYTPTNAIWMHK